MALGNGPVIVAGARTPIGKLLGEFRDLSAVKLGAVAIRAALERAGVAGADVDYVIMGQVLTAGTGRSRRARLPSPQGCP